MVEVAQSSWDIPSAPLAAVPPYARDILSARFEHARLADALRAMRAPSALMTPAAMRCVKASGLSFSRSLVSRMLRERWNIARRHREVSKDGAGLVVYRITANDHVMTFAASSQGLPDVERSGRIKDSDLDFHGALFDGDVPLDRVRAEAAEQTEKVWKGRTDNAVLGWTFANRSNRYFEMSVQALADGRQPELELLASGGAYLLRNAGFYGNGRHGTRAWLALQDGHPLAYPYHVDLLPLYLWREVGFDFVEEVARQRSDRAVTLSPRIKRYLGIGNQSGIGMVAALVRWPHWVSGFVFARELALAFALTERGPLDPARIDRLAVLLERAERYYLESDPDIDPVVENRRLMSRELGALRPMVETLRTNSVLGGEWQNAPLGAMMAHARRNFSPETCEQFGSILIDLFPERTEAIRPVIPAAMATERQTIPEMKLSELRRLIETEYDWALSLDLSAPGARRYFWYRSEENGENRRGERDVDPGLEFETFVDVAGAVQALHARLGDAPQSWAVGRYLVDFPDDAFLVERIQSLEPLPFAEIRANIIDENFQPADMIRFYLHVLGMETTNPKNNRWVRGVFMQGAPLPEDIATGSHSDWTLPTITGA